jgi:gliding motility-associated-like protein
VYWSGNYRNSMDINPGPGVFMVNGISTLDNVFVTKLDPAGNFIWGKNITGNRYTGLKSLFTDLNGNVYITGGFSGIVDFDPGPGVFNLAAVPITNGNEYFAAFILKLDANGDFQWARQIGGNSLCGGLSIATDAIGNVCVTGIYDGITDFDPGPGVYNLGTNGIHNPFVLKLDNAGNFIFAKSFNCSYDGDGRYLKVDNAGNIYTSGKFSGTTDFDPGPGQYNLTTPFSDFAFYIVKLDASGNFVWAKKDIGGQFAVDGAQHVITFDGHLSKYDVNGNLLWTKTMGGYPDDGYWNSPIALDTAGNIYTTGIFRFTQDFDPGPGVYNLSTFDGGFNSDIFLCRLDNDGNFVWAKSFRGFNSDFSTGIAVDNSGNVYSTGVYIFTVDFDPGPGVYNLSPSQVEGVYVHKMSRCNNATSSTLDVTACNSYTLNNITYATSGTYFQTIQNAAACDSLITLHLIINGTNDTVSVSSCDSYTWRNNTYTATGFYRDTVASPTGCNDIYNLNLIIKNKSYSTINTSVCEGQSYAGHTSQGTYIDVFIAANGCDSIRTLNLSMIPKKYFILDQSICQGESFLGHQMAGTYIDTLIAVGGCDSIRTLHLIVNPKYDVTINKNICIGDSFLGHSTSGTYRDILHTVFGCDSVLTTHLVVENKPAPDLGKDTIICNGERLLLSAGSFQNYLWQDGSTLDHFMVSQPGLYSVTAFNGCGTGVAKINVDVKLCVNYFPNAFTPNRDGKNDFFKITNGFTLKDYHLMVFNRYGAKMFETNEPSKGWDGKFMNEDMEQGGYAWICNFSDNGVLKTMKGTVLLLR